MPSSRKLQNVDGPAYTLREHHGDGLRKQGDAYNEREFDDNTICVGHLYFHPAMRYDTALSPVLSSTELQQYMAARPRAPLVVNNASHRERPHNVFAELSVSIHVDDVGAPLLDANNIPIIRLFTIAADSMNMAFDPATHFKNGKQYEGVEIHNWSLVSFDEKFRAATLSSTFRKIFKFITEGPDGIGE